MKPALSKPEAWVWLVRVAARSPTTVRRRGRFGAVKVGAQCAAASVRSLSRSWRWRRFHVNRFLRELEVAGAIRREDAGVPLVRLVNVQAGQVVAGTE